MANDNIKIEIEIEGLTEAQEIAIKDFLYEWMRLGKIGGSRWTAFYADGDGDFRPKIKINNKEIEPSAIRLINYRKQWKKFKRDDEAFPNTGLFIDSDEYAAAINEEKESK